MRTHSKELPGLTPLLRQKLMTEKLQGACSFLSTQYSWSLQRWSILSLNWHIHLYIHLPQVLITATKPVCKTRLFSMFPWVVFEYWCIFADWSNPIGCPSWLQSAKDAEVYRPLPWQWVQSMHVSQWTNKETHFLTKKRHPWKLRWHSKIPLFNRKYIFIHGGFATKTCEFSGDHTHPPPSRSLVLHLLSCWNRSWDHTPSCISLPIISIVSSLSWWISPQKKTWAVILVDHPTDQFILSKGPSSTFRFLVLLALPNTARQVMWWSTCCDLVVVQSSTETARASKMQEELNNNTNMTQCLMSCSFFYFVVSPNVALLFCLEVVTPPVLPCFSTPVESWTSPEMFEIRFLAPWARFSTWSKRPTLDVFTAWWLNSIWKKCLCPGVKIKSFWNHHLD